MEYFSRLPCCMIGITVNSAVFLLNTYNTGLQTGRRRAAVSYDTTSLAPPCSFILYHALGVCKSFKCQSSWILPPPFLYLIGRQILGNTELWWKPHWWICVEQGPSSIFLRLVLFVEDSIIPLKRASESFVWEHQAILRRALLLKRL